MSIIYLGRYCKTTYKKRQVTTQSNTINTLD